MATILADICIIKYGFINKKFTNIVCDIFEIKQ